MRGPQGAGMTQQQMAAALSVELHRNVPYSSVSRWEKGTKEAGGAVVLAYIAISGASRPSDVGGEDVRLFPELRLQRISDRLRRVERLVGDSASSDGFADGITTAEAVELSGKALQTIHNWVKAGWVRAEVKSHGKRRTMVSRADIMAQVAGCSSGRVR